MVHLSKLRHYCYLQTLLDGLDFTGFSVTDLFLFQDTTCPLVSSGLWQCLRLFTSHDLEVLRRTGQVSCRLFPNPSLFGAFFMMSLGLWILSALLVVGITWQPHDIFADVNHHPLLKWRCHLPCGPQRHLPKQCLQASPLSHCYFCRSVLCSEEARH